MKYLVIIITSFLYLSGFAQVNEAWINFKTPGNINDMEEHNGKYYLATDAGLIIYNIADATSSRITKKEGLPSNLIEDVAIDLQGRIWIGTYDEGIALRLNSNSEWQHIPLPEPVTGTDELLYCMEIDNDLNIWVSSPGTSRKYNTITSQWTDEGDTAWKMKKDATGTIWLAGDQLAKIENGVHTTFTDCPIVAYGHAKVHAAPDGSVYYTNDASQVTKYKDGEWTTWSISDVTRFVTGIYANETDVWCYLSSEGLFKLVNDEWVNTISSNSSNNNQIIPTSNGQLLLTQTNGFAPIEGNTLGEKIDFTAHGMGGNYVQLFPASEGQMGMRSFNLWQDETSHAFNTLDVNTLQHSPVDFIDLETQNATKIIFFYNPIQEQTGYLDSNTGMVHYANQQFPLYNPADNPVFFDYYVGNVELLVDSREHYWITTEEGLFYSDGTNWQIFDDSNTFFESKEFINIAEDNNGDVWVTNGTFDATTEGIGIWDGDTNSWATYIDKDENPAINAFNNVIAFDENNVLWIGSIGDGLTYFDGTNWGNYNTSNSNLAGATVQDISFYNNELILATSNGLSIFDGTNFTNYDTENSPLAWYYVAEVAVDANGNIWISYSGNHGASVFNRADLALGENTAPTLQAQVYLEGAYDANNNEMHTQLASQNALPSTPPYTQAPWNYTPTTTNQITSPNTLNNITDWVLVEALDASFNSVQVQAALVDQQGNIRNVAGNLGVKMNLLDENQQYYFIIRHRNHIDIISDMPLAVNNTIPYDFRNPANVMNGFTQLKDLGSGVFAMHSGDTDGNGVVSVADFNDYAEQSGSVNQYLNGDYNLDNNITVSDFNLYTPNASVIGVTYVRY